jgi:hypothetical protein
MYMEETSEFVEIYFSYNDFESDLIKEMLSQENIPYIIRDQRISPYPLTIDHFPERRFAVPENDARRARDLIREAKESGALPGDGTFKE